MPYTTKILNGFGFGGLGDRIYGSWRTYEIFTPIIVDDDQSRGVEIRSVSGQILGYLNSNTQQSPLHKTKWKIGENGCEYADFELLEFPRFPINAYSKFTIYKFNKPAYTGYLQNPPSYGSRTKDGTYVFKTLGMFNRVKDFPIKLHRYFINQITVSGSTVRYIFSETLDDDIITGQRVITSKCASSNNNQNAVIQAIGTNWIEIYYAAGIAQPTAKGEAKILPLEWSFIHRIDQAFVQIALTYANINLGAQIVYNPDKIEPTTGYTTGDWIDFDGKTIKQAITILQGLCQADESSPSYLLGVDESGEWFCKQIGPEIPPGNVIYEGIEINKPDLQEDQTKIINFITVSRELGENESDFNGYTIAATAQSEESQYLYGLSPAPAELETIPGFVSTNTAQLYADATINAYKFPRKFLIASDVVIKNFLFDFGLWRYITKPTKLLRKLSNFDNLPEWTIDAGLDVTLATNLFTSGPASFKFNLTSADNGLSINKLITEFLEAKETILLQIRSTLLGNFIKLSFREDATWYELDIIVEKVNEWSSIEIEIASLNFIKVDEIKLTIQNVIDPVEIYIDQLMYFGVGSEYYTMPLKSAEYTEDQGRLSAKLNFGKQSIEFSEKIASMKNLIDKTRLLSKVH